MAFDKGKYDTAYKRANYKEMRFLVPKSRGDVMQEVARQTGKSISQCVIEALEYYYNIDLHTTNQE